MGLDMYLHAENYISQYDYTHNGNTMNRELNIKHYTIDMNSGMGHLPTEGGIRVSKVVLYWRKANAIHGWFVRELANDEDECQRILVSRDNLITLRDLCVNALANRDKAEPTQTPRTIQIKEAILQAEQENSGISAQIIAQIASQRVMSGNTTAVDNDPLAPTAGFFFGGTERDEYYYEELARTAESINSILAGADESIDYYYQASW
jgi:hypothetical protein